MAAGTRRTATRDRVTVHTPLDVFGGSPRDDLAAARLQRSRQPGVVAVQSVGGAVQSVGGAGGAGTPGKDLGYATRYVQRRGKLDSGQRRVQQRVLSQAGMAVVTARYPLALSEGRTLVQPGIVELQGSMAGDNPASTHGSEAQQDDASTNEFGRAMVRWRPISAVRSPPQEYLTSRAPSGCDGAYGYDTRSDQRSGGILIGGEKEGYNPARCPTGGDDRDRRGAAAYGRQDEEYYGVSRSGRERCFRSPKHPPNLRQAPSSRGRAGGHYGCPETYSASDGGSDEGGGSCGEYRGRRDGFESVRLSDDRSDRSDQYGGSRGGSARRREGRRPPLSSRYNDSPEETGARREAPRMRGNRRGEAGFSEGLYRDSSSSNSDRRLGSGHASGHDEGGDYVARDVHRGARQAEFEGGGHEHVQQQSPPNTNTPSPSVRQQEEATSVPHWQSPRRVPHLQGNGSPATAGRQLWTPGEPDKKLVQKPEARNEALVKSPSDMLLFSKKARPVEFTPCTVKEYQQTNPTAYVELGKLQPDLQTDELIAKRANAERVKEFSVKLRHINSELAARRGENRPVAKVLAQDSRSKALAFARGIPLPKNTNARKMVERKGGGSPEGGPRKELTELEALEALHDGMRRQVQAARMSF